MEIKTVKIKLWGTTIGYLHKQDNGLIGFQYDDKFIKSGIEISPIKMPLSKKTYTFPALPEETYKGLPGMLADSLPDKFGSTVIKRYLESQGRGEESITVLERLCYTGKRGMGALEYEPADLFIYKDEGFDIDALTKLAADILSEREGTHAKYNENMISQLMQGSSSVGGARAKTLIALNPKTNDVRSGQINAGDGYEYWLLKFDGISNNKDKDSEADREEYTKIEYAYYLMARSAGIEMSECKLYKEHGRSHFMTKRFDRVGTSGEKLHLPREYSYEDAFAVMKQLKLPRKDFIQLYRRMVFNEYAKNYDDHTKNIAFLMDKQGKWSLSPAFDLTFSYSEKSIWVNSHQMLINGKADKITEEDLIAVAERIDIKKSDAKLIIKEIKDTVNKWDTFAEEAGLSKSNTELLKEILTVKE